MYYLSSQICDRPFADQESRSQLICFLSFMVIDMVDKDFYLHLHKNIYFLENYMALMIC